VFELQDCVQLENALLHPSKKHVVLDLSLVQFFSLTKIIEKDIYIYIYMYIYVYICIYICIYMYMV
jgi:hypothetical protein